MWRERADGFDRQQSADLQVDSISGASVGALRLLLGREGEPQLPAWQGDPQRRFPLETPGWTSLLTRIPQSLSIHERGQV